MKNEIRGEKTIGNHYTGKRIKSSFSSPERILEWDEKTQTNK